jgi:hypothetical protein
MSNRAVVIAFMVALTAVGGCGGSDEAVDATTNETSTVTETTTGEATTTTDGPPTASWTEFGATVDDWNSAHEPDANYLVDECCHLPSPLSAGARYGALLIDEFDGTPRVWGFSMFWEDATIPLAEAEKVVRQAAPPGAKLTSRVEKHGCVTIAYRSPALNRAFYKGAVMLAALYSRGDQPFNGSVNDISFLSAPAPSVGC